MITKILNFIFPKICIGCEKEGEYICLDCKKTLKIHPEICPGCHKTFANCEFCPDCKSDRKWDIEGIMAGFDYEDLIKSLILKLKYYHQKDVGNFLSERLIWLLKLNQKINFDNLIVTSVPSHRFRKYFVKGYNQSEILAQFLNEKFGIKYIKLCEKNKFTKTQAGLNRQKRLTNLQGAFKIKRGVCLKGNETVVIIDDVLTTGSTINQMAKALKSSYPNLKIWGLVIARHNS